MMPNRTLRFLVTLLTAAAPALAAAAPADCLVIAHWGASGFFTDQPDVGRQACADG